MSGWATAIVTASTIASSFDPENGVVAVRVWWIGLTAYVALHCAVAAASVVRGMLPSASNRWRCSWRSCLLCCTCYLYRILFLHCTIERRCLLVWPRRATVSGLDVLLSPFGGRIVAAVGEIVFVGRCLLPSVTPSDERDSPLHYAVFGLLLASEVISTVGVTLQHYALFALENTLWILSVILMTIAGMQTEWVSVGDANPAVVSFCRGCGFGSSFVLVLYNASVDVPMYLRKARRTGFERLSISEGLWSSLACETLHGPDDAVWAEQTQWLTLNFVFTVTWYVSCCLLTNTYTMGVRSRTQHLYTSKTQ